RTTRAEPFQVRTAPSVRQGLVAPRKQTAKCGAKLVKFGGDSGAVQQVSDIGGGFGRVPFTARSRACHEIDVKREIICTALRLSAGGPAQALSRATPAGDAGLRRMRRLRRIFAGFSRVSDPEILHRTASATRRSPF